ncbi:hypothetical protein ACS0TY_019438 [Phlomoides rotata]
MTSSSVDGNALRKKLKKVVLAYSGGLETSVIVPRLRYFKVLIIQFQKKLN